MRSNGIAIDIDGSLEKRDAIARFVRDGKTLAVATISRDRENLLAEVAFERGRIRCRNVVNLNDRGRS